MFAKRHYEVIAAQIKAMYLEPHTRAVIAEEFATMFARMSGKFDRHRFIAACGVH